MFVLTHVSRLSVRPNQELHLLFAQLCRLNVVSRLPSRSEGDVSLDATVVVGQQNVGTAMKVAD
jgi:hypothetical protein